MITPLLRRGKILRECFAQEDLTFTGSPLKKVLSHIAFHPEQINSRMIIFVQ